MKKRFLYVVALVISLFLSGSGRSQEKSIPPAAERAEKLTEWMKTNLQLTPEQVPTVQQINLKYANKVDEVRNSSQGKMGKMKALKKDNKAKDAELKNVFTADQFKTYQSKKEEIQKKAKEEMKERKSQ